VKGVAIEETQFQAGKALEDPVTTGLQPAGELTVAHQETALLVGDDITLIHVRIPFFGETSAEAPRAS
jgi:hypothetical protein